MTSEGKVTAQPEVRHHLEQGFGGRGCRLTEAGGAGVLAGD